jgi:hypothetical protein|tara:strand:+ start:232 stop:387 length:156 start_codon:yes stop_codon:yes gene_type:complete
MPISQIRDYGQPYLEGEKTAKKLSGLLEAHRENILEEIQKKRTISNLLEPR